MRIRDVFRYKPLGPCLLVVGTCILHCAAGAVAWGQDQPLAEPVQRPAVKPPADVSVAAISAEIERINSLEGVEDTEKANLLKVYNQALEAAKSAQKWRDNAKKYSDQVQQMPIELQNVIEDLDAVDNPLLGSADGSTGYDSTDLIQEQARLAQLEKEAANLEADAKQRSDRRQKIPQRQLAIAEKLPQLQTQIEASSSVDTPAATANRKLYLAQQAALQAEAAAVEKELQLYDAGRQEFFTKKQELNKKQLEQTKQRVTRLKESIVTARAAEAKQQASDAKRMQEDTTDGPKAVHRVAKHYTSLANRRVALTEKIEQVMRDQTSVDARLQELQKERTRTEERVELTGLNSTLGALLTNKRDTLDNRRELERQISERKSEIDRITLDTSQWQDLKEKYADDATARAEVLQKISADDVSLQLEQQIDELLEKRNKTYEQLLADYQNYLVDLVKLDSDQRKLLQERNEFAEFIDKHVLWLRNMPAVGLQDFSQAAKALVPWLNVASWQTLQHSLQRDAAENPLWIVTLVAVLTVVIFMRRRLRGYLRETGAKAKKGSYARFVPTLLALGASILLALPFPLALSFIAWRISEAGLSSPLAAPLAAGLSATALIVLLAEVWRQICRGGGLAEAHFAWSAKSLKIMRRRVAVAIVPAAVLVFIVAATDALGDNWNSDLLGRLVFALGCIAASYTIHRLINPRHGGLRDLLFLQSGGWTYRFRYVWYLVSVGTPLAFAVLALLGYYHTALELTVRAFATVCLIVGLIITRSVILRALLIARRKMAIDQAKQRLAAQRSQAEGPSATPGAEAISVNVEEPSLDLSTIDGQTRRLLRAVLVISACVAVWGIWVDVLPALAVLDDVQVFVTGAGEQITLRHLLFAVLLAMLTFVAWKNVPGLLEIAVLQRLPMEPSGRFAAATVTSYIIAVVGIVATVAQLGVQWQNVQWLVAAMTVGLGFGLQEIFANFISGLIILFERPIRVGDIVTVGNVTGAVTRIQMRATTVTNWDRQELIIPNKEFVTGSVINWTLSDQVTRAVINVGVAYGTDAAVVLDLLKQVAQEHTNVLEDPAPMITFEEFGTSSLNFVVRVYMPNLQNRLKTVTELHAAIQRKFADANIEIAFPQQDIHVRSVDANLPLLVQSLQEIQPMKDARQSDAA